MKRTMKSAMILCLCVLLMVCTMGVSSPSTPTPTETVDPGKETIHVDEEVLGDTLAFTQEEYLAAMDMNIGTSDSARVQQVAKTYLAMARASTRDAEAYAVDTLIAPEYRTSNNIQYHIRANEYLEKLYEAQERKITRDKMVFHESQAEVNGTHARFSVVEDYFYEDDLYETMFNRVKKYTFFMEKIDGKWKICQIKTNDAWEAEDDFEYDVSQTAEELVEQVMTPVAYDPDEVDAAVAKENAQNMGVSTQSANATNYYWTYDRTKAVQYAAKHYSYANYNRAFGYSTGQDCQNFASQCVWAGLGGTGTNLDALPAITGTNAGTTPIWRRNYYHNSGAIDYGFNWAWDNVGGFAHMLEGGMGSTPPVYGPHGVVHTGGLVNADIGDVIWYSKNGTPSLTSTSSNFSHAMVVTKVTAGITTPFRQISDIWIAAHTDDSNSANQPLLEYAHYALSAYSCGRVLGGFYKVAQQ